MIRLRKLAATGELYDSRVLKMGNYGGSCPHPFFAFLIRECKSLK